MENKVKLKVEGLTTSQAQSGAYALMLGVEGGNLRIPVIVGMPEAQSIAIALEGIVPPRPMTHDLFLAFSHAFEAKVKEAFIYKYADGVFYSELILSQGDRTVRIDSRTSDAVAIALRARCGIYTTEKILEECGFAANEYFGMETEEEKEKETPPQEEPQPMTIDDVHDKATLEKWIRLLDTPELERCLEDAIDDENYEHAKLYKQELEARRKKEEQEDNEEDAE